MMINYSLLQLWDGMELIVDFFPSKQEAIDAGRAEKKNHPFDRYEVEVSYIGTGLFTRKAIL